MPDEIVLTYHRDGETYAGSLVYAVPGAAPTEFTNKSVQFADKSYAWVMREVHVALTDLPEASVKIVRDDRPGLLPVLLDSNARTLLRDDPARFIEVHTIAPRVLDLTNGQKTDRVAKLVERYEIPARSQLRIGHDTLADAFGEVIYLKLHKARVESPIDGRWVVLGAVEQQLGLHVQEALNTEGELSGWATVLTEDLLAVNTDQYFLPRAWNASGSWISKASLREKYDTYIKEKRHVLDDSTCK